ncbi:TPA: recombinase family protein, partial [Kluyvera georgiana]
MLRPICYERVSTKNQLSEAGNGAGGLDDQRAAIDRYLDEKKHLFSEDRIYLQDRGISAFRNDNILPGSQLSQLLEGIRNKEYGEGYALVVLSLDRLSRRSSWAEDTIRYIVESGVEIHDISGRLVLNKNDANSKLYMEIVQSRSHNESLLKSTRAIAAWDRKIKEAIKDGKVISNRMPVWLVNDGGRYAVNEKKVEVIRSCFQMYANGMSTGEIVKHYKQKGEALQMVTVSNWVRDRRLLGEHERYNGQVYSGVYPVVIDSELFITANRMMDRVGLEKKKPREDLLLDPEVVKRIFRLYEDGLATGVIVKQLEAGWSTVNVLRVLRDKKVVQMK